MHIDLQILREFLEDSGIEVFGIIEHGKASESYIEVEFTNFQWRGYIPFQYRRTGLFIETEAALAEYLKNIQPFFSPEIVLQWIATERIWWETDMLGRTVTKPFFDELARLEWTNAFPTNNNPQRRIQDIKELGYTVATKRAGQHTYRMLLPIPRATATGYEIFSAAFRKKALRALRQINIYELGSGNNKALIPDHKFPEIRWDANTRAENPNDMPEAEIRQKFQLLDNQRNQQKREVCRRCFQTDKRGMLFGIKYFYFGDENWPIDVTKVGSLAEDGCVGCGWYDVAEWRKSLNDLVQNSTAKELL